MNLAWYPPELPPPERNGFSIGRGDARLPGRGNAAPGIRRLGAAAVVDPVGWSTVLTAGQRARFDRFYAEELLLGSRPFKMPDPTLDGWGLQTDLGLQLQTDEGEPIFVAETWIVQFGDRLPVTVPVGVEFRITFGLSVLPA